MKEEKKDVHGFHELTRMKEKKVSTDDTDEHGRKRQRKNY